MWERFNADPQGAWDSLAPTVQASLSTPRASPKLFFSTPNKSPADCQAAPSKSSTHIAKRDSTAFKPIDHRNKWLEWSRSLRLKFGFQGIHHPLNPSFDKTTLTDAALAQFNENNYFVFTVLYDTVKYSSGKSILNDYIAKDTPDGQAAMLALAKDDTLSAAASVPSSFPLSQSGSTIASHQIQSYPVGSMLSPRSVSYSAAAVHSQSDDVIHVNGCIYHQCNKVLTYKFNNRSISEYLGSLVGGDAMVVLLVLIR